MGQQLSPAGLLLMADDLVSYGVENVLKSLVIVRKECNKLNVKNVVDRIQTADARVGADEAWATAILALDERETVVWTQESAEAFDIVRPLLDSGDEIGARVAFRDAYNRLCSRSVADGYKPVWIVSSGWDNEKRREVLRKAVDVGRISTGYAHRLLPAPEVSTRQLEKVLSLACEKASDEEVVNAQANIARLKILINVKGVNHENRN
jgi:hypothetical protein